MNIYKLGFRNRWHEMTYTNYASWGELLAALVDLPDGKNAVITSSVYKFVLQGPAGDLVRWWQAQKTRVQLSPTQPSKFGHVVRQGKEG